MKVLFTYTLIQKCGVSLKEINFIQFNQVKTFTLLHFYFKDMNFEFLKKKIIQVSWKIISTKISSSKTVFNIDNNKWAANQHIRMISEGSCDTEEMASITGINYILKYIQVKKKSYFKL